MDKKKNPYKTKSAKQERKRSHDYSASPKGRTKPPATKIPKTTITTHPKTREVSKPKAIKRSVKIDFDKVSKKGVSLLVVGVLLVIVSLVFIFIDAPSWARIIGFLFAFAAIVTIIFSIRSFTLKAKGDYKADLWRKKEDRAKKSTKEFLGKFPKTFYIFLVFGVGSTITGTILIIKTQFLWVGIFLSVLGTILLYLAFRTAYTKDFDEKKKERFKNIERWVLFFWYLPIYNYVTRDKPSTTSKKKKKTKKSSKQTPTVRERLFEY